MREREKRRRREEQEGEERGEERSRLSLWSLGEESSDSPSSSLPLPPVVLAAFNLGYLPKFDDLSAAVAGGSGSSVVGTDDGTSTEAAAEAAAAEAERAQLATATRPDTTVLALEAAARLLAPGGTVSVCSYFQHEGGGAEAEAVRAALRGPSFDPRVWTCVESRVLNRPEAPVLTLCYRSTRPRRKG